MERTLPETQSIPNQAPEKRENRTWGMEMPNDKNNTNAFILCADLILHKHFLSDTYIQTSILLHYLNLYTLWS